MKLKSFTWIPLIILPSLITRVPTLMATQYVSLQCLHNVSKTLGGPPSLLKIPLFVLYANMHFLEAIPCNVLSMRTFSSNRSLIGPCIHDISFHEFFWGLQSIFTTRGSHLHHSGSPSWIIPYLGIQGIQLPFKSSCITLKKYFRRGSYQIPSYLVPHRNEHFYIGSWLLAPSFWFLPHQQCFMGTFTTLSTIFQP